ncbi:hypothetical protein D584_16540 [Brucella intermedia M86]|uniref:Uncharacterized protein n=1 Tax=Brucella intermedia M86 TaxID=1234597 RepID=M5JMI3_9HYPH|nr:hypothetical protein D584_16540 [Brucella intermedia M86]
MPSKELPTTYFASQELPTARLRWNNGILEQAVQITHFGVNGHALDRTYEWRAVPEAPASALGEQSE